MDIILINIFLRIKQNFTNIFVQDLRNCNIIKIFLANLANFNGHFLAFTNKRQSISDLPAKKFWKSNNFWGSSMLLKNTVDIGTQCRSLGSWSIFIEISHLYAGYYELSFCFRIEKCFNWLSKWNNDSYSQNKCVK